MVQQLVGTAFWQKDSKLNNKENTQLKSVMDFRLMGLAHSAFFEETGEWGGGLRNIYEHMTTDYVYPDIYNVAVSRQSRYRSFSARNAKKSRQL